MSNWFHRNPLKATSKVKFNMGPVASSLTARAICSELATLRENLLSLLTDPSNAASVVIEKLRKYIALIMGLVNAPENSQDTTSKLRADILFKWTNTLQAKGTEPTMEPDAMFEVCSMLYNVALWLTKHGAKIAAKEDISPEEAKEVHSSFRHAAGLFLLLKDTYVPNLSSPPQPETDLCLDVLEAYLNQSIAEAQEVTLARAMELKHDPALIAGLAKHTASIYDKAHLALQPYPIKSVGKWRKYLEFKRCCYETCAYVYFAENLLKEDKAGPGLAIIAEAENSLKTATEASKHYGKAEGVGLSVKMAEHCFFRRLNTSVANTRRKLERENSLIYHQRPPITAPECDLKPAFGVVVPEAPELSFTPDARWKDAYIGFDRSKLVDELATRDKKAKENKEKPDRDAPVQPVSEKPIFSTDKDPTNESGCVIS